MNIVTSKILSTHKSPPSVQGQTMKIEDMMGRADCVTSHDERNQREHITLADSYDRKQFQQMRQSKRVYNNAIDVSKSAIVNQTIQHPGTRPKTSNAAVFKGKSTNYTTMDNTDEVQYDEVKFRDQENTEQGKNEMMSMSQMLGT